MIKRLLSILKMTESEIMIRFAQKANGYDLFVGEDFLWMHKKENKIMLVSHADTIKRNDDFKLIVDEYKITALNSVLGGDDRCGVAMCEACLEQGNIDVLLTNYEESGCLGAKEFSLKFRKELKESNINALIEIDRRGINQFVYYDEGNKDLIGIAELLGMKEERGSMSDVMFISEATGIAHLNISAGYYNEHTINEFIDTKGFLYQYYKLNELIKILNKKDKRFCSEKRVYKYVNNIKNEIQESLNFDNNIFY